MSSLEVAGIDVVSAFVMVESLLSSAAWVDGLRERPRWGGLELQNLERYLLYSVSDQVSS
jgi:hypothetical protein